MNKNDNAPQDVLPRCAICGDTVPLGKQLCWCCEHGPKIHVPADECSDACEIHYPANKS